jgi:hypothetical protein
LSGPACPTFSTPRSKEIDMNRKFASTFAIASTAASVFAIAAIVSGNAYADDITIDDTPFVSTKTRAEVRAEVIGQSESLRTASSEWAMQMNEPAQPNSAYTREAAQAEYIASRDEVNSRNAEHGGSSYFAALSRGSSAGVITAGVAR